MLFTSSASTKIYLVYLLKDQRLSLFTLEKKIDTLWCSGHMKDAQCQTEVKLNIYFAPSLPNRGTLEKFETACIRMWYKKMDFHILHTQLQSSLTQDRLNIYARNRYMLNDHNTRLQCEGGDVMLAF